MGRITIFVADSCPDSFHTVATIKGLTLPYTIINVTKHPYKRKDMMSLSMGLSTPQVFFNTRHIGGKKETLALLHKWDNACDESSCEFTVCSTSSMSESSFTASPRKMRSPLKLPKKKVVYSSMYERYMDEIGKHPDPVDPRLALPNSSRAKSADEIPRITSEECCLQLPNGKRFTVWEITEILKDLISHDDSNEAERVTYKRSFLGHHLLSAMIGVFEISNSEALAFTSVLLRQRVVCPLQQQRETASFNTAHFYRLQCYNTPDILNSYRIWVKSSYPDAMRLVNRLIGMMQIIELEATDSNGNKNFLGITELSEFGIFEEAVCELQGVDLHGMSDVAKMAFGINLYNLMIKYARVKIGVAKDTTARNVFYSMVKFNVGGHIYSFNDWEHGILRGNVKSPHGSPVPFSSSDPRRCFAVKSLDPRIHFALNRGTRSCPPIYTYTTENLDMELDIAAATFCESERNVALDKVTREMHVSNMFRWYQSDFVRNMAELPEAIAHFAKGVKKQKLERFLEKNSKDVSIHYMPFDWSSSDLDGYLTFDPSTLKMEQSRRIRGFLGLRQ